MVKNIKINLFPKTTCFNSLFSKMNFKKCFDNQLHIYIHKLIINKIWLLKYCISILLMHRLCISKYISKVSIQSASTRVDRMARQDVSKCLDKVHRHESTGWLDKMSRSVSTKCLDNMTQQNVSNGITNHVSTTSLDKVSQQKVSNSIPKSVSKKCLNKMFWTVFQKVSWNSVLK